MSTICMISKNWSVSEGLGVNFCRGQKGAYFKITKISYARTFFRSNLASEGAKLINVSSHKNSIH